MSVPAGMDVPEDTARVVSSYEERERSIGIHVYTYTHACSTQYSTIQTVGVHLECLPEQSSGPAAQTATQDQTFTHATHRQDTFIYTHIHAITNGSEQNRQAAIHK
jgi:hypothetical protein